MSSFRDVPLEIALEIIKAICPNCTPRAQRTCFSPHRLDDCVNPGNDARNIVALARLCQASKFLNSLATPHLYHRPTCVKWPFLARTLILRPDLARHVKHLRGHAWIHCTARFPWEVLEYLFDGNPAGDPEDEPDSDPVDVLPPLCPNLEDLELTVNYGDLLVRNTLGSLRHLRNVKLSHADTEGGMHFHHLERLNTLAPQLTRIFCDAMDMQSPEFDDSETISLATFSNLTDLRFDHSAIAAEWLPIILAACPRLQSFSYQEGGPTVGYSQFTPQDAQEALIRYAPNLVSLRLDIIAEDLQNPSNTTVVISSLTDLSRLEHLALNLSNLLPEPQLVQAGWYAADGQLMPSIYALPEPDPLLLVHLLPASIRSLTLSRDSIKSDFTCLRAALVRLAEVAADQFPRLEKVTLSRSEEEDVEIKVSIQAYGIRVCLEK